MKKIKSAILFLCICSVFMTLVACGQKVILSEDSIKNRLTKIITDATVSEMQFHEIDKENAYYEGSMYNDYAEYYFKLDAYTGKTLDWKRTIKYLSESEFQDALNQKYENSKITDLKLVVEDTGRYYTGILYNKFSSNYSYYSFKIDAFDANNVIEWEDVTSSYVSIPTDTNENVDLNYCSEYTVKDKLSGMFDPLYLNSCELQTDSTGTTVYAGQFTTSTGSYTFTADAVTGQIINYTLIDK